MILAACGWFRKGNYKRVWLRARTVDKAVCGVDTYSWY